MRNPLLFFALCLPGCLAAQSPSLTGMPFKGDLIHQQRFTDNGGENVLIVSSIDHPKEQRNDIFAYQYRMVAGKPVLVWDIQDFSTALCNMAVAEGSIQVIDLDQDGLCEVSLLYQQRCDGLDPYITKLILYSKGKKYAIRGLFSVEDGAVTDRRPDPANAGAPAVVRNFLDAEWAEFAREGNVTSAKHVELIGKGFRVLALEDLMAGGGTTYELQNSDGSTTGLDAGLLAAVQSADAVTMTADKSTLIYASVTKGIGAYTPASKAQTSFMTFFTDTEQLSSLIWSPNGKQLAFIALNTAQYPLRTRIFVLSIEGGKMIRKDKYDVATAYSAAADWVIEPIRFVDGQTLEYAEFGEGPEYTLARLKVNP
jgi:hypothetical protein